MGDISLKVNNKYNRLKDKKKIWIANHIKIPNKDGGLMTTNAFGQVQFKGATRRAIAKFARLDVNTNAGDIFKLLVEVWNLEQPRLLISVTGGAKSFSLKPALKNQFTVGLLKVAQTPGAWVITGGTNTGVMKHVGEALEGAKNPCIGIATWGIVTNADALIDNDGEIGGYKDYKVSCSLVQRGAFLDHNHTHHLLVDDGSIGKFAVEIPLRSRLEEYIMKTGVPSVLMVLEGGPGTLNTVREAISKELALSVVIIVGSGRAADLLAYAYDNIDSTRIDELVNNPDKNLLNEVIHFLPELKTEQKQMEAYKEVLDCMKKKKLISLFHMSEKSGVDEAILKALLKAEGNELSLYDQLKLTLLWDRYDLAKDCILNRSQSLTEQEEKDLNSGMIMAIAMNRVDFVKLFLSYGISIQSILSPQVLEFLYGYLCQSSHSILSYVLKKDYEPASGIYKDVMQLLCSYEKYDDKRISVSLNKIKSVIKDACSVFMKQRSDQFIEGNNGQQEFKYPYKELFFFALLSNMHEMAIYLWRFEEDSLEKAFFGIKINSYLSEIALKHELPDDIVQELKENASIFQKLCTELLDQCFRTDRIKTEKLITCTSNQFNSHTCLSLAVLSDHKDFISHNAVQTLMNDVWTGDIKDTDISWWQYLLAFVFPPYISFFEFESKSDYTVTDMSNDEPEVNEDIVEAMIKDTKTVDTSLTRSNSSSNLVNESHSINDLNSFATVPENLPKVNFTFKMLKFYFYTPVIKFLSNLIGYLLFIMLFSYVAMVKKENTPSVAEWILVVYIVSLTIEELRQIIQDEALTLEGKLNNWWSSHWNKLDAIALSIFFVGLGLRFHVDTLFVAHVLYAINAGMWVFRLLNVFYVDRVLGPYVVMIFKMFVDMCSFLLILFVFLVAYGVSSAAILMPQDGGIKMILDAVFHPYFNIYGELFIDRDPANSNTTRFGTDFHHNYAEPLAWILLGFYLLIANVLLLNLLIAIFNNTYEEVQSNAEQIGKFERYSLIMEYATRPPLIPPFILLCHIYMLVMFFINIYHGRTSSQEKNLRSILTEEQREEITEFENECKSELLRKQYNKKKEKTGQTG